MKDMAHREPMAHREEVSAPRLEVLLFLAGFVLILLALAVVPVR